MISKSPLVSICIPTYNRTNFLLAALDSCFKQTYKNFEIIITDNSDSDETKKAITELKNKQIRFYKNSKNIGSFSNLIHVTKLAKGKYVKLLLDDDLLEKNCLKEMVKAMEENKTVGVVCAPLQIIDQNNKVVHPRFYLVKKMKDLYRYKRRTMYIKKEDIMIDFLTKQYPCCVPTGILYRKSCLDKLGSFDENFQYICDVELCMRIASEYDFYYIDKYLSYWRYTSTSETVSILHKKGINQSIFYDLTKKYINNVKKIPKISTAEKTKLIRASYLFASKRTTLNIVAGITSMNILLILKTFWVIHKNDPYIMNKIKLPFVILREVLVAFLYNIVLLLKTESK